MPDKTKVFISWSGAYTKLVAIALKDWLEDMFDVVQPFVSDRDIEAGQRPMTVIEEELRDTSFGVILVTQENQFAPWFNFEAGALSKQVSDSQTRVIPLLLDMDSPAQLEMPLIQFQAKLFSEDGVKDLIVAIARAAGADVSRAERRIASGWGTFSETVHRLSDRPSEQLPAKRTVEDMVEDPSPSCVRWRQRLRARPGALRQRSSLEETRLFNLIGLSGDSVAA